MYIWIGFPFCSLYWLSLWGISLSYIWSRLSEASTSVFYFLVMVATTKFSCLHLLPPGCWEYSSRSIFLLGTRTFNLPNAMLWKQRKTLWKLVMICNSQRGYSHLHFLVLDLVIWLERRWHHKLSLSKYASQSVGHHLWFCHFFFQLPALLILYSLSHYSASTFALGWRRT